MVIHREIGYRQGEMAKLGNLGLAYQDLGQIEKAIECVEQALEIYEKIKSTKQFLFTDPTTCKRTRV